MSQYGSQGTAQTLQELNAATTLPAVAFGAYANVEARTYVPEDPATHFNGSDFLPHLQQAIDGDAIFVASVMVRDLPHIVLTTTLISRSRLYAARTRLQRLHA